MEQILKNMTLDFFGRGKHKIGPDKLLEEEQVFILDVRSHKEAEAVSINMGCFANIECRNIPVDEIPDRTKEIPADRLVAVFCPANVRSSIVYAYLLYRGFENVRIIDGGYAALTEAIKPGRVLKAVHKAHRKESIHA